MRATTTNGCTTMDRPNRERELTALAGLHTAVLQRWRELEDISFTPSFRRGSRDFSNGREEEEESNEMGFSRWSRQGEGEELDGRLSSREESTDLSSTGPIDAGPPLSSQTNESPGAVERLDEGERVRVRPAMEWMHLASQQMDLSSVGRRERDLGLSSRERSTTENEDGLPEHAGREQIRLLGREDRLELIRRMVGERQTEVQELSDNRAVSEFAHRGRLQSLFRGRFLQNGLLMEDEQSPSMVAGELSHLRQCHCVTGLREGFRFRFEDIVHGQVSNHSDTSVSSDASSSENLQFHFSSEGDLPNENHEQSSSSSDGISMLETPESLMGDPQRNSMEDTGWSELTDSGSGTRVWQQGIQNTFGELHEENEEVDTVRHVNNQSLPEDVEDDSEDWHEDSSNLMAENWQDDHSDPSINDHLPMGRDLPADDETVYSMELRELVSRRSVSNLLQSRFRESLDHLIQSYVEGQGRTPFDWTQQSLQSPAVTMGGLDQEGDNANANQQDFVSQTPLVPLLPSNHRPNLQQEQHHHWMQYRVQHSVIERDVINDLRTEMVRLHEGMNRMQRMLEACMDMQLELQQSIRQEVSAALDHPLDGQGMDAEASEDGSKWNNVRKGSCCICCDSHINSLLYRCGHMCTCLTCANELVQSGDKCPLCRAPVIEVIRVYSSL